MKCKNCGREISGNMRFCKDCGAALSGRKEYSQRGKKKNILKIMIIFITIIVFFLIAVVAGYFIIDNTIGERRDNEVEITSDQNNQEAQTNQIDQADNSEEISTTELPQIQDDLEMTSDEIEEQVLIIREDYNSMLEGINLDQFEEKCLSTGEVVYSKNTIIRYISAPGDDYNKYFCFDEQGTLYFAYYEADDANRLYFHNNQLMRWRYSADALEPSSAVIHDLEDSNEFDAWEKKALEESDYYRQLAEEN